MGKYETIHLSRLKVTLNSEYKIEFIIGNPFLVGYLSNIHILLSG